MSQPSLTPAPPPSPPAGSAPSAPGRRDVFTVAEVVRAADRAIRERARPLWVRGEISDWNRSRGGHYFFTLKDDQAALSCALWAGTAQGLPALPSNGMEVEVFGELGIYTARGQFRLVASDVRSTGVGGLWQVAKERLVAQLRGEGLLDEARKRPLPSCPDRVGIVTSLHGSVLHDMHRVLRRKAWWIDVLLAPCNVEGAGAAAEIAAAIRRYGASRKQCPVDVLIVARGGGSMESLWGFNREEVARAIAECPVPVVSAVGHETDYTVADLVADVRAATPTAGAEYAVPDGREIALGVHGFAREASVRIERSARLQAERLAGARGAADRAVERRVGLLGTSLDGATRHLEARSPWGVLRHRTERTETAVAELHAAFQRRLRTLARHLSDSSLAVHTAAGRRLSVMDRSLSALAEALDARSPLRVLARGYALVTDADSGHTIRSARAVRPEQRLQIEFADGMVEARAQGAAPAPPSVSPDPEPAP